MTTPYGLTSAGLVVPNTTQLLDKIAADQAAGIDPNLNTSPDSVQGQENAPVADALEQVWEVAQVAYNAFDPDAAEDFLLDSLCALTGTLRQPATPSFFNGTNLVWVGLAPNTTVPAGSLFAQLGDLTNQYEVVLPVSSPVGAPDKSTVSGVTVANPGVFTTSSAHGLSVGMPVIVTSSGALPGGFVNTVYYVTSTSFAGSTFTLALTAGGTPIQTTDAGSGTITVAPAYAIPQCQCTTDGPTNCNANLLSVIVTPLSGLYSVANPSSTFLGTAQDDDPSLRLRRESELRASGSGSVPAIEASLLELEVDDAQPIQSCTVFENDTDGFDPTTGLPPHSFEALIYDGQEAGAPNDLVAQTIWKNKAAGIRTVGNTSGTALSSLGVPFTINFSRANLVLVSVAATVKIDASKYDATAAKNAVVAEMVAMGKPGIIVAFSWFMAALQAAAGVVRVESVTLFGGSPNTDYSGLGLRDYPYTVTGSVTITTT